MCLIYYRDGRIRVGDEIINVCGKRLRGLTIDEAIKALKQPKHELDIVVARESNNNGNGKKKQPNPNSSGSAGNAAADASSSAAVADSLLNSCSNSTSFFDEERLRDEHLRIAQKIHAGNGFQDYAETCSEVNLSSRPSKNGEKTICLKVDQHSSRMHWGGYVFFSFKIQGYRRFYYRARVRIIILLYEPPPFLICV